MLSTYLICGLVLFFYMSAWFSVSVIKKRNDIADIAWGGGFLAASYSAFFANRIIDVRSVVVLVLVTLWGLRLLTHITLRNKGKKEDPRYNAWRKEWGKYFLVRSFFQIYMLQGALILLIATPLFLVLHSPYRQPWGWIESFGVLLWTAGFFFETAGDYQLLKFIRDPNSRGTLLTTGLWRYTRHPNYFGEVTQWWGIFLLACGLPYGYVSVIGPVTITVLIVFVSGIPMLEKQFENNEKYQQYKTETSCFFPMPPKTNR